MFCFLKKFERPIALLVFLIVGASFLFTGKMMNSGQSQQVTYVNVNGVQTNSSDIYNMVNLLNMYGSIGVAANDGVLARDMFDIGLTEKIFARFKEQITKSISRSIARELSWRPYQHPVVSYFSLESCWAFCPYDVKTSWIKFIESASSNTDSFAVFKNKVKLFKDTSFFNADEAKMVLVAQISRMGSDFLDQSIMEMDLSMFGYDTAEKWLGREFLNIAAHVILSAAHDAHAAGIDVSLDDARADIVSRCAILASRLSKISPYPVSKDNAYAFIVKFMGGSEKTLLETWKKVMLFREFSTMDCPGFVLDRNVGCGVADALGKGFDVEFYIMKDLFLADIEDRKLFEMYCSCIDTNWLSHNTFKVCESSSIDFDSVPKELQYTIVRAKYVSLEKGDLVRLFDPSDILDWQVTDEGWDLVTEMFPFIKEFSSDRVECLDNLDDKQREEIREKSLSRICELRLDTIKQYLMDNAEKSEEKDLDVGMHNQSFPFKFITNRQAVVDSVDNLSRLDCYTEDGYNYLCMIPVSVKSKRPLTFMDAKQSGVLKVFIDQAVASSKLSEEEFWKKWFRGDIPQGAGQLNERMHNFLNSASELIANGHESVCAQDYDGPFEKQWKVESTTDKVLLSNMYLIPSNVNLEELVGGAICGPFISESGVGFLFKVLKKLNPSDNLPKEFVGSMLYSYDYILNGIRKERMCRYFDSIQEFDISYVA